MFSSVHAWNINTLIQQGCIQKKFWGNVFSWGSGLLSIPAKPYWFILFCFALLFSCIRCSFEENTRKLIVYLRNLSDHNFLFCFFILRSIFGSTHNVLMLISFHSGSGPACLPLIHSHTLHTHHPSPHLHLTSIYKLSYPNAKKF